MLRLSGGRREQYLDEVWAMYEKTYAAIGMGVKTPTGLLKYHIWDVFLGSEGVPIAFTCYKDTKFGLKSGTSGSDGSSEGKSAALASLRKKFNQPGVWGEVSGKVLSIAVSSGATAVCAELADDILGKVIEPVGPLEYYRNVTGVGRVKKVLIGHPQGVPVTNFKTPYCPANYATMRLASERCADDECDLDAHYACLI